MTSNEVITLAYQLMDKHGLKADGWIFRFNNRMRAVGLCRKFRLPREVNGRKVIGTIELQRLFALTATVEDITDTILHEIAHAIAGVEHGHNDHWKTVAARIGCSPKACQAVSELSGTRPEGIAYAVCPSCSYRYKFYRKLKGTTVYHCRYCGPERGTLTIKPVNPTPKLFN